MPRPKPSNDWVVATWNELIDALFADAWRPDIQRYRSRYAFRGVSQQAHGLQTSLQRLGVVQTRNEGHLLRNFRKYAHRDVVPGDSIWAWLSLAQHHGLPTRLLDWSFSPHVAMHFATQDLDRFNEDGVIYAVDYIRTHQLLPKPLRRALQEEDADVFTADSSTVSPEAWLSSIASGDASRSSFFSSRPASMIVSSTSSRSSRSCPARKARRTGGLRCIPTFAAESSFQRGSNGRFATSSTKPTSPSACCFQVWTG